MNGSITGVSPSPAEQPQPQPSTTTTAVDLTERFIEERTYLRNVTAKTQSWYRQSFNAFHGAMQEREAITGRVADLRKAGVSATSVNTYLRAVNSYLHWMHMEGYATELVRIPKLRKEQKVIETLWPEQVQRIIGFKPRGRYQQRIWVLTMLLPDTALRIEEALSLRHEDMDLDNCLIRGSRQGTEPAPSAVQYGIAKDSLEVRLSTTELPMY